MSSGCLNAYFFFFKQKTAYEMRISDWSSDACSSDLREGPHPLGRAARAARCAQADRGLHDRRQRRGGESAGDEEGAGHVPRSRTAEPRKAGRAQDRQSVESGKSVSVRVDLGGRCILKTQTQNQDTNSRHPTKD